MAGRPIDEKIVVMKLDDSDFTKKAANTTGTLGKLRDALNRIPGVNLGRTAQDLGKIQDGARSTNMEGLANSVNMVAGRFTNLGIVGVTALQNITNRAVNAGMALTKSLTMDQVTAGFGEYETKIKAIGTVLSNTEWAGTKLPDVKKVLGELNDYADQTVYNFGQMTENIGRFTAAGVRIEDSATAIKGLSNLAAASGSDVNQLNTAMYQMSQAMASGKLNLMDWNSLVNAGMGGKKTQDALLATAKAMGKNVDMSDGFRNSIEQGWLTSEVLLATLQKFGKDKSMTEAATAVRTFTAFMDSLKESIGSGWATTWEIIFGDFEQATIFWTDLSETVGGFFAKSTEARNNFLSELDKKGGIVDIFDGIANASKPVIQVFKALSNGFKRAFPPMTVSKVLELTGAFNKFTRGLSVAPKEVARLTRIFHGIFSVFSSAIIIAKELGKAFLKLIPEGTGGGILNFLDKLAKMAIEFNLSLKAGNNLTDAIGTMGDVFGSIAAVIGGVIRAFANLGEAAAEAWSILVDGNYTGKGPWEEDSKIVDWLFKIRDAFKAVGDWIKNNFQGFGGEDLLGAGTLVAVATLIGTVIGKVWGLFNNFGDIVDGVTDAFEGIGDAVQNFAMGINIANLLLIAIALGVLAGALKTLEKIEPQDLAKGITALAVSLGLMMAGMVIMNKFNVTGGMRVSATLLALAASISIMADALKKISDLKPEELKQGMSGLVVVTVTMIGAIVALSKWSGKIKVGSIQLIALAGSISILTSAVKKMSEIDTTDLFKSIGALAILFAELAIFLKIVDKTRFGPTSAVALLAVAGAVNLMVVAIKLIDTMDVNSLIKGLVTITVILAQIVIFSKVISSLNLIAASVGLTLMAVAMNLMIPPLLAFGSMSWTEIAKGLTAMAGALVLMAGAAMLASGSIGGAAAVLIMAAAMNALIIPIKTLGEMTWGEILKGIVGLAAGMALMAGAALLLSPAVVPMLAFGAALLLMGTAALAVGAGLALFATGLATLATLTAASVAAIVSAIALLLKGFAELIPAVVDFVVKLGLALINGIMALVPPLANAVASLIVQLLTTITTYLPSFIEKGTLLLMQLLEGMGKAVPTLIEGALVFITDLISGLAQGIRNNGPELVGAMMELIGAIVILVIQAGVDIINAVFGWIPGVKEATSSVGAAATKYVDENFKASEVGSKKGQDFANALNNKSGDAKKAGSNVGKSGKDGADSANLAVIGGKKGQDFASAMQNKSGAAKGAGSKIGQSGKDGANSANLSIIGGQKGSDFASAMQAKYGNASTAGKKIADGGKSGAGSVSMNSTGSNFGAGFASGISGAYSSVVSAAKSLAKSAASAVKNWLDIRSPSRITKGFGNYFGEGLAIGIYDKVTTVGKAAKSLAQKATSSLNQFLDGFTLPKEDSELKFKAVVDYDKLDPKKFGRTGPIKVQPDTSFTSGMVTVAKAEFRQNADKTTTGNVNNTTSNTSNNYNINIEAKDTQTRAGIKRLAEQVQTELKNMDDRKRMSRGEGVAF